MRFPTGELNSQAAIDNGVSTFPDLMNTVGLRFNFNRTIGPDRDREVLLNSGGALPGTVKPFGGILAATREFREKQRQRRCGKNENGAFHT